LAREQRRLAAIVSADVVGYSQLMGRDESATLARLREHRKQRFEPIVARHGGRLIKLMGDGALVEFSSALDALAAAIGFQQAMKNANAAQTDDTAVVFRMGVHLGDLIVEDDDVYGDSVNVAARLESRAEPGGIVISGAVHDAVIGRLKATFDDLGSLELKNIERPVRGFRVDWQATDWGAALAAARDIPAALAAAEPSVARALLDRSSIAVLPFVNISGDPEQEYFADGLAEDIITELSRFREFAVIARNSTFTYKGKAIDVTQVGRELAVEHVLEGSVRRSGNRVRVTAQLINTADNKHLWAERYDRQLDDVFAIQEEITRTVVASISWRLFPLELGRHRRLDQPSDEARRLIWQGWEAHRIGFREGSPTEFLRAIDLAKQAIAVDAQSLDALLLLAGTYRLCRGPHPELALEQAWSTAERMLRIDPTDARTLGVSGGVRVARGDVEGGIADLHRAHELNPNAIWILTSLAISKATIGMSDAAIAHALLVIRLSPLDPFIGNAQLALAMASFALGRYDEAVRWAEVSIQSAPTAPIRRMLLIACSAEAGDMARAKREIDALRSFAPDFITSVFQGDNPVFIRADDRQRLLSALRKAGLGS